MPQCIFCKSTNQAFNTREHILPESLGGGEWAVLPDGLFFDDCQNKFGSTIEQQALADYPFSLLRVFLGIPTKKGKSPWLECWEGKVEAGPGAGIIGYSPTAPFRAAVGSGQKSQMRILAHPLKPEFVCRTLLKMGLEVVAADDAPAVFQGKFDAARRFALEGQKQGPWWYLQREDISAASSYMRSGVTIEQWQKNVRLETVTITDDTNQAEIFHLKLLYLDVFVPLEQHVQPPEAGSLPEPEFRLFSV